MGLSASRRHLACAAVIASIAALAGCTKPGSDGYFFRGGDVERVDMRVTLERHATMGDLVAQAGEAGAEADPGNMLMAWSEITNGGTRCTIHIMEPKVDYRPDLIGHELMHCFFGRWHP